MEGLELYKKFIDGLVKRKAGVLQSWILETGYHNTDDNEEINILLNNLTDNQREILSKIVIDARIGGIYDTLAYMMR